MWRPSAGRPLEKRCIFPMLPLLSGLYLEYVRLLTKCLCLTGIVISLLPILSSI